MASSLHIDPLLLGLHGSKIPGGMGGEARRADRWEVEGGGLGTDDAHHAGFRDRRRRRPLVPGGGRRCEVTGFESADCDSEDVDREDVDGGDVDGEDLDGEDHDGKDLDGKDLDSADVDSEDLHSIREDTPGIDIAHLPKTPIGAKSTTAGIDDRLSLKLALKPATTATGLVQSLALVHAKEALCMSSAEWLRFQREIIRFLNQGEWLYESYHEAAYAFLEGTGANERFFGVLADAEAEQLLVNRGGLAWDIDNDRYVTPIVQACCTNRSRIIELVATVVAAWKEASAYSDDDIEEECPPPVETHHHTLQITQRPQLMPQVIAMLPRDIIDECMAAFPVKSTREQTNSSKRGHEDNEGSSLFIAQHCTSSKRKRQTMESDSEHDDDSNKEPKRLQPSSEGNKRRRGATQARISSSTAGTTAPVRNPAPKLFTNKARPTLMGDALTPQAWTNPNPPLPAPWMPCTLHIHGVQLGPTKLLSFNSITTLDGLLDQFRNAFDQEMSNPIVTNKCRIVRRIRVYHKLLFDTNGLRIEGDDAHAWEETMKAMRKMVAGREFGRIEGSVEVHF